MPSASAPSRPAEPAAAAGRQKGRGRAGFAPSLGTTRSSEIANAFANVAAQTHGDEAVWPYFYAGTMGLVQRDGINRLRHAMRYRGQDPTICTSPVRYRLGRRHRLASAAPTRAKFQRADLIVCGAAIPVNTQVNVMTHIARARRERGAKLVVIDTYRTGTARDCRPAFWRCGPARMARSPAR